MTIMINVIDCAHGRAAEGIAVSLERQLNGTWGDRVKGRTDENGRLDAWQPDLVLARGVYRLELDVDGYFATLGITPAFPKITVVFRVVDAEASYQLPILIGPYAYMTYRPAVHEDAGSVAAFRQAGGF